MILKLLRQILLMSKLLLYGTFLQTLFFTVLMAKEGKAQRESVHKIQVSVTWENITLSQAFSDLEQKTPFKFTYHHNKVDDSAVLNFNSPNTSLGKVLLFMSENAQLRFQRINDNIHVGRRSKKDKALTEKFSEQLLWARDISGKVTDENGEGLPGVNVLVKASTVGTITDTDGNYKISVPDDATTLVFTYVGYLNEEVEINGRSVIDLQMTLDVTTLSEVVVVGYGTQKKATLTGSAISLNADDIQSIPTSQLSNSLAGRAPGVQIVNNSGLVGANSSINIRGTNTAALYVIDNVVSDKAQFDVLDPNEIENISFLKDAATAAIYGARAAGGVVVVTTKSGKSGKVRFTYSNNFSVSTPTQPIQDYTAEQEIIHINNQQIHNGNAAPYGQDVLEWARGVNFRDVNDEIFKDPTSQQHNLSVNGGNDNVTYFLSTGFNKASGTYDNTNFNRYNFRAKVDAKVNEYLKIGANISGNRRETDRFYWPFDWDNGEGFTVADFYRSTFNWSRLRPHYTKIDGTPTTSDDPDGFPVTNGGFNPVEIVKGDGYRRIVYNTFNANINVDLDIPKVEGLSVGVLGNYRQDTRNQKNFVLHNRSFWIQHVGSTGPDQFTPGPLDLSAVNVNNLARTFEGIDEVVLLQESYQFNAFLRYENTFGAHGLNAMLGYEIAENSSKSLSGSANELLSRSVDQILGTQSSAERRNFTGGEGNSARVSYFGRVNYNYNEKYIAEFSFRSDGSYKFPEDNRFGFFPSISAAWRISQEDFFDVSLISNLKLRGSIGSTGFDGTSASPDPIAPFQFQNNFRRGGSYLFEDGLSAGITTPAVIPNPSITWETHNTINIGLDLGLLEDKITIAVDVFRNNITDVLASPISTVPGTFGSGLPSTNVAEKKINGFEIIADYKGNIGSDIKFNIGANMGFARDEWVKFPVADGTLDIFSPIGKSQNRLVGYVSRGIIRDQATLDALPSGFTQFGRTPKLGDILFEDINGTDFAEGPDGIINDFDRTIISENTAPRINYGIRGGFTWRGFALDVLFQGVAKYDKFVRTINTGGAGVFQIDGRPYFELWTDAYSADNPGGRYPRIEGWGRPELGHGASTFWNRSGAYVRLKNVSLTYTLPENITTRFGVENMSVFANGSNLFIITEFDEHDAEQETLDSFPIMKTFSGGIKITF